MDGPLRADRRRAMRRHGGLISHRPIRLRPMLHLLALAASVAAPSTLKWLARE
jgi:hypothetical protein